MDLKHDIELLPLLYVQILNHEKFYRHPVEVHLLHLYLENLKEFLGTLLRPYIFLSLQHLPNSVYYLKHFLTRHLFLLFKIMNILNISRRFKSLITLFLDSNR